jgi:diguanylate cyclase (GGDEF)-like protein
MSPPSDHGTALRDRLRLAAAFGRCPVAVVYGLDGQRAWLRAADGPEGLTSRLPPELPSWRVAREAPVRVPVIGRGPAAPETAIFPPELQVGALLSAPLLRDGRQVGSLVMADDGPREDLADLDLAALGTLAQLVGEALEPVVTTPAMRSLPPFTAELAAWPLTEGAPDPVTGLPDRRMLADPARLALEEAADGGAVAVARLALDRFQRIDDWLGGAVGDELLRQVAERLLETTGERDLLGRGSGDEFLAVLTGPAGQRPLAVLDRMSQAIREPFHVHGYELSVSATIGVARFPQDAGDLDSLLRYAGIALHRAKAARRRGQVECFTDALRRSVEQRGDLERHLRRALGAGELRLHYQPKVDLASRAMRGVEALIRWQRGGTLVSPGQFLPVAEESELIVPIGTWVMHESCRQLRRWMDAGVGVESVSVNVSALQFARPDFTRTVGHVLRSSSVPPGALELEVTETSLMDDVGAAADKLASLRELGVKVSVDDFGTGYSSLSYLQRLPVDVLKIDRSFVKDLDAEGTARAHAQALTEAITGLGHGMGLSVLAEGVETEAQLEALAALGCDQVQGYYFSKPVPAAGIEALEL